MRDVDVAEPIFWRIRKSRGGLTGEACAWIGCFISLAALIVIIVLIAQIYLN